MKLSHTRFIATDGTKLAGLLFTPSKQTKKVALFLHGNGFSSIFESVEKTEAFAQALTKNDIAFFPFNNRGAGYIRKLKKDVDGKEEEIQGGTAYELIKDCIFDIDGAIAYLKKQGFTTFYLIGESTGANKICVYNYYQKKNPVSKVVLLSGGDDTGVYYHEMGEKKFNLALKRCQEEVAKGHGLRLIPKYFLDYTFSYQSLYDTLNPDGDYNMFPYTEYFNHLELSKKKLFREYESLTMPVLVVYGANDEYCYGKVPEIVNVLEKKSHSSHFKAVIIPDTDHGLTGKTEEGATIIAKWFAKA